MDALIPTEETEVGVREQPEDQRRPELYPEPDLDIPTLPEDQEKEYTKDSMRRSNMKTRRGRLQWKKC